MKKKILSLFVIILLSSVSVYAFDGKGECLDPWNQCPWETGGDNNVCPEGNLCVNNYYCGYEFNAATCQYAGFSAIHCQAAGGAWQNYYNEQIVKNAGCSFGVEGYVGSCDECNNGDCAMSLSQNGIPSYGIYNCKDDNFCAETEGQAYCAPPDFSQEHCTTAGGTWDGITETCQVSGPSFNGKGECPDSINTCNTNTQCPNPGNEDCALGYYCARDATTLSHCGYAGESFYYCNVAGGAWDNNFWGGTACVKTIEGHDYYAAGFEGKVSDTQCEVSGTTYDCFEGYYCAFASTPQGSQFYCAPPDFSQEHCTTAGGTWDGLLEICNLGVETCSDVIQNQDETDVDCGGICAVRQKCKLGEGCSVDTDCVTNKCFNGLCKAANVGVTPAEKKVMSWFEKQICYKNVNSDFCKKFKELEKQYINENTIKPANEKVPVKPKLTVGDLKPSFFQKLRLTFTGKFWDFNN